MVVALRGFFHPAAGRKLLWDLRHALELRSHVGAIGDPAARRLVEGVLDRYEEHVVPRWPSLREQVVHGDLNLENVLLDERGRIAGIVDFGDIAFTAQVADFAVGLASLAIITSLRSALRTLSTCARQSIAIRNFGAIASA